MICSICNRNKGSRCGFCSQFNSKDVFICDDCNNISTRLNHVVSELSDDLNNLF